MPAVGCVCTACVLHVYCMCTACVLHVYCMCTACVLHVYCICTACVLHVYCMCIACVLHVYCMCTACVLHVYCMCIVYVFSICSGYWTYRTLLQAMSLYWSASSSYGLAQNVLFNFPRVRRALNIPRTPSETQTPFKDLWAIVQDKTRAFITLQREAMKKRSD